MSPYLCEPCFVKLRHILLQRLSVTRALQDFLPFQKLSFGGRQSNVSMTIVVFISCQFQDHVRSSLDQECQEKSLSYYDKVVCNFAEIEDYYVEKTWFVFELHSRNTFFASETFVKKGAYETKLERVVSDPPKRKSKKRKVAEKVGL